MSLHLILIYSFQLVWTCIEGLSIVKIVVPFKHLFSLLLSELEDSLRALCQQHLMRIHIVVVETNGLVV